MDDKVKKDKTREKERGRERERRSKRETYVVRCLFLHEGLSLPCDDVKVDRASSATSRD